MTPEAAFAPLLAASRALWRATPELQAFQDWPDDLTWADRAPVHQPVTAEIAARCPPCTADAQALADALPGVFHHAEWRVSYSAEEVGQDFITRYGYFELYGPTGMYHTQKARSYVGFWGPNLWYPEHRHEAEEIYYICGGGAELLAEGEPNRHLGPGETQTHTSNQVHAMQTHDQPVLVFVLWRGAGMAGLPEISS